MTDKLDRLAEAQAHTDELIKQTQEELGVLIRMMDEWTRRNPASGA